MPHRDEGEGFAPHRSERTPADRHRVELTFRIVPGGQENPLGSKNMVWFDRQLRNLDIFSLHGVPFLGWFTDDDTMRNEDVRV